MVGNSMDDEYRGEDSAGEGVKWSWWMYLHMWLLRPLYRGLLFGMGHYLSYRLIGPYISRQFAIKSA